MHSSKLILYTVHVAKKQNLQMKALVTYECSVGCVKKVLND